MQVENLKAAQAFINIERKMTCNEISEASSLHQNVEPAANTSKDLMDDCKFEGINLEDDIEKVELSSPELSDSSEDEGSPEFQEFQKKCQLLNGQPQVASEELRNWLMKIKEMQNTIYKKMQLEQQSSSTNSLGITSKPCVNNQNQTNQSRVMKYQDLPYMGEITLDNSKPRRGRKPKKADICHLIYKNYGTILPGTPNASDYIEQSKKTAHDRDISEKHNVQSKIISSLLEKRLTQKDQKATRKAETTKKNSNEPINLCVRDHNQLKIKLTKNSDDTYSTEIKSEPQSDSESDFLTESSNNLNNEYGVPQFLLQDNLMNMDESSVTNKLSYNPSFGLWPNNNEIPKSISFQEQLMYYQKLAAINNVPVYHLRPPPDIIPIENKLKENRKVVLKIKPKETKEAGDCEKNSETVKRNHTGNSEKSPTKRKRSAIFIPPIPSENNTTPATEVSICKFKFTGGAKPTLQEKKMLSVDSGGNFRYYSGTGDKSMRGYEFFPRETLQQTASATQGSSTGAFLQASGEKFFPVSEMNEKQVKSEFLLSPDLPSASPSPSHLDLGLRHKKRKSRKSLQREKLEQTFKEKGFLIQTQQLESAEGATYCKFRQLRKFTRYLFRSWKDYLPGNVQEIQENGRNNLNVNTEMT